MYFCHEYQYDFPLMDYLNENFGLQPELDCVLFMRNTDRPGVPRGSTETDDGLSSRGENAEPAMQALLFHKHA